MPERAGRKKIGTMKELQKKIEALTYDEYSQCDQTTPSEFVFSGAIASVLKVEVIN